MQPGEAACTWWSFGSYFVFKERTRLRDDEHPLVTRVLHGPCEKISKILITEADLGEEVTYDVRLRLRYSGRDSTCSTDSIVRFFQELRKNVFIDISE